MRIGGYKKEEGVLGLAQLKVPGVSSISFKSNQKIVDYSPNSHATTVHHLLL